VSENANQASSSSKFIFDITLSTAIAADGRLEARAPVPNGPLLPEMLDKMNRYWRAANYLCIGQIYLFENPLLREPLKAEQIKPRLLGHWGTSPGQNLIYIHLKPIASLNVLLTSHAWRNDHNGFSHQTTGFVDNALARRSDTIRVYYPPDSNCLLSVFDHCLRSRNYVNIVTCGKQPQLQWLNMDEALEHCSRGASTWKFATNDGGAEPDVVLACAGDVPTIEICAASWLLQKYVPGIKVRVVNVVDLMTLMYPDKHPHGMDEMSFNALFTENAPVIFAFHNNRWLIHTMIHGRSNEGRFHVHGYMDQGTTTTPFDMVVLNEMSRYQLALDALKHVPRLRMQAADAVTLFGKKLNEHHDYIRQNLEDMPEIRNWQWTADLSDPAAPAPMAKGHPGKALFTDS